MAATDEDKESCELPDYLEDGLDIIVVGVNPSLAAAQIGHYYAGTGNHFWECLHQSGLCAQAMTCYDDASMLQFGIGFTNFCSRPTKGASELSRKEIKTGAQELLAKIKRYQPKIVVFNGKGIYEAYLGHKNFYMGRQPEPLRGTSTIVFVMPSSSARCAQLPRAVDKLPFFIALRKLRDYLAGKTNQLTDSEVIFPDYTDMRVSTPDPKSLLKAERRRKRLNEEQQQQQQTAANAIDAKKTSTDIGSSSVGASLQHRTNGLESSAPSHKVVKCMPAPNGSQYSYLPSPKWDSSSDGYDTNHSSSQSSFPPSFTHAPPAEVSSATSQLPHKDDYYITMGQQHYFQETSLPKDVHHLSYLLPPVSKNNTRVGLENHTLTGGGGGGDGEGHTVHHFHGNHPYSIHATTSSSASYSTSLGGGGNSLYASGLAAPPYFMRSCHYTPGNPTTGRHQDVESVVRMDSTGQVADVLTYTNL